MKKQIEAIKSESPKKHYIKYEFKNPSRRIAEGLFLLVYRINNDT
jgi:hypothetical protein